MESTRSPEARPAGALAQGADLQQIEHRELRLALLAILITATLLRLIFAQVGLDGDRFWDEQWSVQNVAATLGTGSLKPAHSLYPTLAFLPHTAVLGLSELLHQVTGREAFAVFANPGRTELSATGYFLARLVAVAFGVWSLWLLFRLGSRVLDPASAMVGVLFLAAFWRHVRASGQFQPNIVALALILLAAGWCLEAGERRTWTSFLLAGSGVGLATSAKQVAALVALVLVAAVALQGRQALGLLPKLAGAAVTSLVVFVLLNPWVPMVLRDFQFQVRYYERAGAREGGSPAKVLAATLEFFTRHLGMAVALAAAVGLLLLLWRALRGAPRSREVLPLLAFGLGFPLLYAAITPNFESQNMLLAAPVTCLAAGWTLVSAWRWLEGRFHLPGTRAARRVIFLLLFTATFRFPVLATYEEAVPTTAAHAADLLATHLTPLELRVAFFERADEEIRVHRGGLRLPTVPFKHLSEVRPEALDLADCEIFPAARLSAKAYRARLERPVVAQVERIGSNPLSARGQELVLVFHPWHAVGPARPLEVEDLGEGRRRARLGGLVAPGEVISIAVITPQNGRRSPLDGMLLDGRALRFYETTTKGSAVVHFHTERLLLTAEPGELLLDQRRKGEGTPLPRVELLRWWPSAPTSDNPTL